MAQEKVDVQRPLVGLVDDDRVVLIEVPIALHLGQQDAVGHELDEARRRRLVVKTHLVADGISQGRTDLVGHAGGDGAGGDTTRLRVPDGPVDTTAGFEADFRELRRLAGARLAADDDDAMPLDGFDDVAALLADRQLVRIRHRRHARRPKLRLLCRPLGRLQDLHQLLRRRLPPARKFVQAPLQTMPIAQHRSPDHLADGIDLNGFLQNHGRATLGAEPCRGAFNVLAVNRL